jgi:16S rRNA (adenine(1408)-N(1))-methyltransferase
MRLLNGTKVVEAPPGWREAVLASARPIVIDVGAGDGRFVYESAGRDPDRYYVGLDPDADAMAGVENAAFVVASVEQLPPELTGLAAEVRVNFPWVGLLRGVIRPEASVLAALRSLAAPGAAFRIVLCYDPQHDSAALAGEDLPVLDEAYIDGVLLPAYAAAGLQIRAQRRLTREEALAIPSTWGRRLLHGRPRAAFHLEGVFGK